MRFGDIYSLLNDYARYCYFKMKGFARLDGSKKGFNLDSDDYVTIAARPTGGLGDYIVSKKLIDELTTYGPCRIDIYCENEIFGEAVYGDNPLFRIVPADLFNGNVALYDLAMTIEHFVHIHVYSPFKLRKLVPELYSIVLKIRLNWNKLYLNIPDQCYRERVHFQQMKMLGLDRYTELRMGGNFKIPDKKVVIPLKDEEKNIAQKLVELNDGKTKYITFNYGADKMHTSKMQLKVWPKEYYTELLCKIKKSYPDIGIIQIGGKGSEQLEGVDKYLFGKSLETIKWVLKGALFHIDCEGGLVHLGTQLGTKCIVIFGPTPEYYYGYEENINMVNQKCNDCMGLHPLWPFECFRKEEKPECMYGITPELVKIEIDKVLS